MVHRILINHWLELLFAFCNAVSENGQRTTFEFFGRLKEYREHEAN